MEGEKEQKAVDMMFVESTAYNFPEYIKEINSLIQKVDITRKAYKKH